MTARRISMARMRVVQAAEPNGPLELVERDILEPGPGQVRVKVQACGVCHSDSFTKEGTYPGISYPRVPGHEGAGVVDAIGPSGTEPGAAGQREISAVDQVGREQLTP
jgi:D-arabinose 1-dehydrogenase-like Zn-dependent alcohol dehydrogenase